MLSLNVNGKTVTVDAEPGPPLPERPRPLQQGSAFAP